MDNIEWEKDLVAHVKEYIKLNTKKCECCRCSNSDNLFLDETDYELYCEEHLIEMLTENDNQCLLEFLDGGE